MSLLDTINGAREEAAANSLRTPKNEGESAKGTDEQGASATGFSKRSTARAKPKRELAGTVRTGSKPTSEMTKEEKRAARQEKRSEEDLMYDAKKAMLEGREDYQKTQRVWWILLIAGVVCTVISWLTMQYIQNSNPDENLAIVSVVFMVIAYVLIIGAFIFDLVKVRPLRKSVDNKILGMSKRRLRQVVEEEEERKAAKKAKK